VRLSAFLFCLVLLVTGVAESSARVLKGEGPTSLAAGFGSVWVGMGGGDVVRIDAQSGRVRARLHGQATGFVHGLVVAYGAVWVVRGEVLRIDPQGYVARTVPGAGSATAFSIRAGAGALWVADDGSNEILRIDPERARLVARVPVPGRAWGVAAGPGAVVVLSVPRRGPVTGPVGPRLLHRVDRRTNQLSAPLAQLGCDAGIAVGHGAVWTFDACNGMLARRDPRTLRVLQQRKLRAVSQTPALGFGSVWLASRAGVLRVDPATLRIRATIPARSLAVAVGADAVWALDHAHATLRKVDPRTNRVVGARIAIGRKS
jgi:DNA-binding beta-propeller fold protein YncE